MRVETMTVPSGETDVRISFSVVPKRCRNLLAQILKNLTTLTQDAGVALVGQKDVGQPQRIAQLLFTQNGLQPFG